MPAAGVKTQHERGPRTRGRPSLADAEAIDLHLLKTGLQAFLAEGFAASMSGIARTAGVSKTTLYARFSTKEQLFRAIMRDQIARVAGLDAPRRAALGDDGLAAALQHYSERMLVESFRGDLGSVRRLILSETHRFPELGILGAAETQAVIERLTTFLTMCAEEDDIPCQDPAAIAGLLINAIRGKLLDIMLTGCQLSADDRTKWANQIVCVLMLSRPKW